MPRQYSAAFKERAVKLAVESEQLIAQTARDLGINENTLQTWIGKYHRTARQEKEVHDEHLYEAVKRLRKENARLKEERDIFKKAVVLWHSANPTSRHAKCWRPPTWAFAMKWAAPGPWSGTLPGYPVATAPIRPSPSSAAVSPCWL
jgi:transposase